MQVIDAHQHFWKIDRGDYFWMDESVEAIRRDILPPDLQAIAPPLGVTATVVVQAAATVEETAFLLGLARQYPWIQGVVGWVDLTQESAPEALDRLACDPHFKGIRPMLQDIEDSRWVLQPIVIENLKYLATLGLSMDALITPRHLEIIHQLADEIPDLPMVIDHCAKPLIADGKLPGGDWRLGMRRLSGHPQLYCKLSGLANEYGANWSAYSLTPVAQHVLECFGPERVMWGSDWPVLELAGTYSDWLQAAETMTKQYSEAERQAIFSGTASRFYRLN